MKTHYFSVLFYISNICGVALGAYLVAEYSLYRILVLYCLFNIILLWITEGGTFAREDLWFRRLGDSKGTLTCLAISVMMLLSILVLSSYGKLYDRPSFMPPLIALTLVLMTILALASIHPHSRSFFTSTRFVLPVMILMTLFVNFSIYLVQPNVFSRPLFESVDAYRDYVNAARIVKLSGFRPEDMVLHQYYAVFPVVPMLNSITSLVGGLSIQEAQIMTAVIFEIVGVVAVWLLSIAVAGKVDPAVAPSAGVLAIVLVWLQPYFIQPGKFLTPIRFSIPLVGLVVYLSYRTMIRSRPLGRYVLVPIFILVMAIIPMHASSTIVLIAFCLVTGLLTSPRRRLEISVALIALMFLSWYLMAAAALPFISTSVFVSSFYDFLMQVLSGGPAIIFEAAASLTTVKFGALYRFMETLPLALALSMCTICIVKSSRLLGGNVYLLGRKLNSLNLVFAVVAIAGLAGGYLGEYFRLDMRYFGFPSTLLLVIACAVVLGLALKNVKVSGTRGLILIGIVTVYAFSMASSPLVLYETNPSQARMIPTESESAAAQFVSTSMQEEKGPFVQILSDWPFNNYVLGLMYSSRIGIENKTRIVEVMFNPPEMNAETIVILRQYYLQNLYLNTVSPYVGVLKDVGKWNSPNYNKVYDSSTTSVYLGTFVG